MKKCENCSNLDYCVDAGEPCADYECDIDLEENDEDFEDVEFEDEDFEDEFPEDEDEFDIDDYTGGEDWEDFCEHEDFE